MAKQVHFPKRMNRGTEEVIVEPNRHVWASESIEEAQPSAENNPYYLGKLCRSGHRASSAFGFIGSKSMRYRSTTGCVECKRLIDRRKYLKKLGRTDEITTAAPVGPGINVKRKKSAPTTMAVPEIRTHKETVRYDRAVERNEPQARDKIADRALAKELGITVAEMLEGEG